MEGRSIQKRRKGPRSHPCRTPARKASHSGCSPPSLPAHPSAPSPRLATKRRMGKKAGRRRRRPRGPCSGTGPPSSRPMKGAGQGTGAGPPPAPTPIPAPPPGWKRDESFPRPPLLEARCNHCVSFEYLFCSWPMHPVWSLKCYCTARVTPEYSMMHSTAKDRKTHV